MSRSHFAPRTVLRLLVAIMALTAVLLTASAAGQTPNAHAQASPPLAQQAWQVNAPEGLNLRAGPSQEARVLTLLPPNTRLTLIGRAPDGTWAATTYQGQGGWVDSRYLVPSDEGAEPPSSGGRYIWPVRGRSITTAYSSAHPAIDIDQYPTGGNPVLAIAAGTVTFVGGDACCSYGLHVRVVHPDGAESLYAHLQAFDVREGQAVSPGQTLGTSGNTGYSTGAHLHFELRLGGVPVDPFVHLPH